MSRLEHLSRREIIVGGMGLALAAMPVAGMAGESGPELVQADADPWRGLKVGVASYTLRTLPLEACIKAIQRTGLKYVSIKDSHMPMNSTTEQRKEVAAKFKAAGITPLSCGNVGMENDEAKIRAAFEYARDAGLPTIVCSPHPDSFAILDKMVKEFDIKLAIHNHGPGDNRFPSPYDAMAAAEKFDKRIGLCIDVGHTARAGVDPAEAVLKCKDRLYDMHFKDINSTMPNGAPVEVGRGVLNKRSIVEALLKIKYTHLMSFEYEKDANDPVPGLMESVGYLRGLMSTMPKA
ncbi:MAG: sugar phosphate isomerase/epimerase [Chthonomonadales bacterium]